MVAADVRSLNELNRLLSEMNEKDISVSVKGFLFRRVVTVIQPKDGLFKGIDCLTCEKLEECVLETFKARFNEVKDRKGVSEEQKRREIRQVLGEANSLIKTLEKIRNVALNQAILLSPSSYHYLAEASLGDKWHLNIMKFSVERASRNYKELPRFRTFVQKASLREITNTLNRERMSYRLVDRSIMLQIAGFEEEFSCEDFETFLLNRYQQLVQDADDDKSKVKELARLGEELIRHIKLIHEHVALKECSKSYDLYKGPSVLERFKQAVKNDLSRSASQRKSDDFSGFPGDKDFFSGFSDDFFSGFNNSFFNQFFYQTNFSRGTFNPPPKNNSRGGTTNSGGYYFQPPVSNNEHYQTLGLKPGASPENIRQAYKKLVLECHPDKNKGREKEAEQRFIKIQKAYEALVN